MFMKFELPEIGVILRRHVVDEWNIPEESILSVRAPEGLVILIEVKTREKGGGPYRSQGNEAGKKGAQ